VIKFCRFHKDLALTDQFSNLLEPLSLRNVFNPSFLLEGEVKICGFRAIPNENDWIMSYLWVDDGERREVRNISHEFFDAFGGRRLIDPKIFRLGEDVYATFNSGWIPQGNDIFVMKIYPRFETPKRVVFAGCREQERNWAFFSEGGEIFALYQVSPLRILRLANERAHVWEMEQIYRAETLGQDLSIGTPLSGSDGKYSFVGHKKIFLGRKKIYLGRFCQFDFHGKKISLGKNWLVHSMRSLLGSTTKHNDNLISCTYFSGIQESESSVSLGYGINDVAWGFSVHQKDSL
jgi:hypothetical protein